MTRLLVDAAIAPLSETWRDSVRHAAEIVTTDGTWRESYAPTCFLRHGEGAEVQASHDGPVIGTVRTIVNGRDVHVAELLIDTDDEQLLARVKVGQGISLDGRSLDSDDNLAARLRRHFAVDLHHVAVLADREIGWFPQARILRVRKLGDKAATATSGRLTAEQAHAEVWRRVKSGLTFADAYTDELIARAPGGNWYLPPPQWYIDRSRARSRGARAA